MSNEQELREQICIIGELMHRFGFVDGATAGNISARLDENHLLITPSGVWKGFLKPEQLLVIDLDGNIVVPADGLKPSSETPMHLAAMKKRSDVGGVVHAHPTYATVLTMLGIGIDLQRFTVPEAIILLGKVPTAPYAKPSSDEDADAIETLIVDHQALMLHSHGSLTVGKDVWQAYSRLETLEHAAKLIYLVYQAGGMKNLPSYEVERLWELRRSFGLTHPEYS